jgi:5'-methylthioadenosine phosphorylase
VICGSGVAAGDIAATEAVVIARHGAGIPAHLVDHEANLRGLLDQGVDRVLALASTGSLRTDWPVGTVVIPDDFFAPWATPSIFTDTRGHSVPGFDPHWRARVVAAWASAAASTAADGGVYVQTTGPRFETPAEIRFLVGVGDVVGMTVASECIVAAELGLAYAAVCMVDNLANGLGDGDLTVAEFEQGVAANRAAFASDVRAVARVLAEG